MTQRKATEGGFADRFDRDESHQRRNMAGFAESNRDIL